MIPGVSCPVRYVAEHTLAVVGDRLSHSVYDLRGGNNLPSEHFSDNLMAEAYPKYGNIPRKGRYNIFRDPCVLRSSRSGGYYDPFRGHCSYLLNGYGIVSENLDRGVCQFGHILKDVVGKGIKVVNYKVHLKPPRPGRLPGLSAFRRSLRTPVPVSSRRQYLLRPAYRYCSLF